MRMSERMKEKTRETLARLDDHALECELHTVLQHIPDERAIDLARLYQEALGKPLMKEPPTRKKPTKKKTAKKKSSGGLLDQI